MTEIGNVHISVMLGEDGPYTVFSLDNVAPEEAIGRLTVVIDRLRSIASDGWGEDDCDGCECPHCGESLHDEDDEDDGLH